MPLPSEAPVAPLCATVQLKVVPYILLVKAIKVESPEHIVLTEGVAIAVAVGFTVIVTIIGAPTQPPKVGVTV